MPRLQIPDGWTRPPAVQNESESSFSLRNSSSHAFFIHALSPSIFRVVHQLPTDKFHQKYNDGIKWEDGLAGVKIEDDEVSRISHLETSALKIQVDYGTSLRLTWTRNSSGESERPFLTDSKTRAYTYDASSGAVFHFTERELYLPTSEEEFSDSSRTYLHPERNEFIYGLGETGGRLMKDRRRYTMGAKDSLAYDWKHGDPLYKITPFYVVYNKLSNLWYGIYYNNLSDSVFDMGAECDALWGSFRSYRANSGPLDYYVILADGTLPSIIQAYASLVTPYTNGGLFTASQSLPPLGQFGYLASSLGLAERTDAQGSIIDFVNTSRQQGFPIDGLYLSSGWCQDPVTGDRNYFVWNTERYPTPAELGATLEKRLSVKIIANTKPWLLESHPLFPSAGAIFVQAAKDSKEGDGPQRSVLWSKGFGDHKFGSYIDFSSDAGCSWWRSHVEKEILANNITGIWIDNNEFSGLDDDESRYRGEVSPWEVKGAINDRIGWGLGEVTVGRVGRAVQTMGMAKCTYETLLNTHPNERPVIVSRSGLPGIQAYAHATWSGDNSTTWTSLKYSTHMTLSVGLSFGPGLYGHDIGGFAGKHSPSAELLVRWCQHGVWHTRFTVHSWKEVDTTLWMYNGIDGITEILRDVLAFRYRLAPTFYSLYVSHYFRHGWPVMKPLLWLHSVDARTLAIDDQFLFGTHVLVAPVVEKGARRKEVYLPSTANDGEKCIWWCELDTGKWYAPEEDGQYVTIDAPLSRTPVLVRAGGILVLGGRCTSTIYESTTSRTALLFPSPRQAGVRTAPLDRSGMSGSFTLIEDDGISNDHTTAQVYTELSIWFKIVNDAENVEEEVVVAGVTTVREKFQLPYEWVWFVLPKGDRRRVLSEGGENLEEKTAEDGATMFGLKI